MHIWLIKSKFELPIYKSDVQISTDVEIGIFQDKSQEVFNAETIIWGQLTSENSEPAENITEPEMCTFEA